MHCMQFAHTIHVTRTKCIHRVHSPGCVGVCERVFVSLSLCVLVVHEQIRIVASGHACIATTILSRESRNGGWIWCCFGALCCALLHIICVHFGLDGIDLAARHHIVYKYCIFAPSPRFGLAECSYANVLVPRELCASTGSFKCMHFNSCVKGKKRIKMLTTTWGGSCTLTAHYVHILSATAWMRTTWACLFLSLSVSLGSVYAIELLL